MPVDLAAAAAFTYVGLPVGSGGAHGLGRMGMDKAYAVTEQFIATCATVTDRTEPRVKLRQVPELDIPESITTAVRNVFGDQDGGRTSAERGIELLEQIAPQPTNEWGMAPVRFVSTATVQLNDPATGAPLPGQDPSAFNGVEYEWSVPLGLSQVRLMLDNRASLAVELCIPNSDPGVLCRVAPWLQENLPFRLSAKHWRAWFPTKTGSFLARRMPDPLTSD